MTNNVIQFAQLGFILDIDYSHGTVYVEDTQGEVHEISWTGMLNANEGANVLFHDGRLVRVLSEGTLVSSEEYLRGVK